MSTSPAATLLGVLSVTAEAADDARLLVEPTTEIAPAGAVTAMVFVAGLLEPLELDAVSVAVYVPGLV
jgi:hypothetical protein